MVCLYVEFNSGSLSSRFSSKCKCLSATALLSGKLVFESFRGFCVSLLNRSIQDL